MAALIGNPQDVLTTPYGYSGQMSPETAVQEQALNRRRLIANMLMQQGLQQPQGRMAGRFFVAPNPLEHVAGLAQFGAGLYSNYNTDNQQKDIIQQDRQSVVDAIKNWKDRQGQLTQASQAPVGVTPQPTPPEQSPRPEGPYNGEVGAVPMPDVGVTSSYPTEPMRGPAPAQPAPNMKAPTDPRAFLNEPPVDYRPMNERLQSSGADPGGLSKEVTPADMSQFATQPAPQATPAQPLPPSPAPAPTPQAAPRKPTMDDLAELLTHQHPVVRQYGAMLAQQMQKEQEHAAQREFLSGEKAMDRDVRREGILENSRMREAQLQNTMALTQMQIEARMQQGKDANDLKAALAQQAADLQKLQMQNTKELKQAEIGSRKEIAKSHDETLKAVAGMRADQKQILNPAQEQKMRSSHAKDYQALTGIDEKNDLAINRIDRILDQKKSSSFNNLYGGYNAYATQLMPGETQDIKNELEALKANLKMMGFELIRQGGSIGQMTEREWPIVADQIAKLDNPRISEPEARRTLEEVKNFLVSHKNKARETYDMEWGESPYYQKGKAATSPAAPAAPSGGGGWSIRPIQ